MTKKDYAIIAKAIANTYDISDIGRASVANEIARALAADNPRFDRNRFLTACGVA